MQTLGDNEVWIEESDTEELIISIDMQTHVIGIERLDLVTGQRAARTYALEDLNDAVGILAVARVVALAHLQIAEIRRKGGKSWWQ